MTERPAPDPADRAGGEAGSHGAPRQLTAAARRALAEAEARRAEMNRQASARPVEVNGRSGPDPARYGDWEVKGIASDF